ncbi:protein MLN51 homolog [Oryza brachyantha]|uniref:protein MLN51 homolog n=1 Tax=Oryza brachyantha TaxID=4533 RepID=UPI001ADD5D22|nr:protein MLN51 homolog [Oryza brachyantha]XP_006654702.2 protein MLN51 homolog [Oryza brachyantha]XP_015693328.2 protein MLN51 homolog [Oryza brachyantha]
MADREKAETETETEEEYESDLDDAPLPAVRRRAAASDDEEEDPSPPTKAGSDAESDGQGAAEVYDDDVYEDDDDEEEYEVYEEFEQGRGGERGVATGAVAVVAEEEGIKGEEGGEASAAAAEGDEGKKGSEPYAVPTTGAFYMHDDRFQEARGRVRQRRILSNRQLWNAKEDQAWVHDRFDEMNLHDFHNDYTRRRPRDRFRGRGGGPGSKARGSTCGNFRGNKSQTYYHDGSKNYIYVPKEPQSYHDNTKKVQWIQNDNGKNRFTKPSNPHDGNANNFDFVPKESRPLYDNTKSNKNVPRVVRGRGSKRYQQRWRSTAEISSENNNESHNLENSSSNANLEKHQHQASNSQPERRFPMKQTIASNLNSASPPFYPSRSSRQELPVSQKGNAQPSTSTRPFSSPISMESASPTPQYGPLLRGKAFVQSAGQSKLHPEVPIKGIDHPSSHLPTSPSTSQFPVATNQVTGHSFQSPHPVVQQRLVQSFTQSTPKMSGQMLAAQFGSGDKLASSLQSTSTILTEGTGISSPRGSSKSNTRLMVKGQHSDQGEEHASFMYGGAQVLGATGSLGDQNFRGTPALLPVMQFGGQHPGGPGVPSIGMALPGFVSQRQLGLSNSEMTWVPILTGASGAMGATYGSPYIAVDSSYYPRASEHASSSVSLREPSASSQLKSQEITEALNDELNQRQHKLRRYSEMNFGQ